MTTSCSTCHGLGEIPSGGQTMTSATSMSWGTCPDCHGAGVTYDCQHCCDTGVNVYAIDFDPTNPAPCRHCQPTPEPTPAPAGTLVVDGYTVTAPTFRTARQFDAAVGRAFADGLTVAPSTSPAQFAVHNPTNGATYHATRTRCTCPAGERDIPCKHVAVVIATLDIWQATPVATAAAA